MGGVTAHFPGVSPDVRNLGIEVQNLCNCKQIPAAKQVFLQMLGTVSGKADTQFCLDTHAVISDTEKKLKDEPASLLQIYTDRINAEPVQIARAKLVLDAAVFLSQIELKEIFQLKAVKSMKARIKQNFFQVYEDDREEIFVEVLLPKLKASVGTRTGNPKNYKDRNIEVFVSPT